MTTEPEHDELLIALAAAWGVSSQSTDSDLDETASQILGALAELRDQLPLDAPMPDVLAIADTLPDKQGWRREITIQKAGGRAASDLIQLLISRPAEWPKLLQHSVTAQTRRYGQPGLVAIVDALTRLAAPALSMIAQEQGQQLPELLEESLPYLRPVGGG